MIDIETKIYNRIKDAVTDELSDDMTIRWSATPIQTATVFPVVVLYEMDNAIDESRSDSDDIEQFANVTYQVEIYANSSDKRKQCKRIASAIDDAFRYDGFSRLSMQSVGNLQDNTIYRMVGRYVGKVDTDGLIYRR